jgi:hypothetical protein
MATTVNTMQTGLPLTSSYATFANFPSTGSKGVLYIDENNADLYLWTGSVYEQQSGAGGGGTWGSITGTLSNQADLMTQLGYVKIMTSTVRETNTANKTTLTDLTVALAANKKYVAEYDLTVTSNGICGFRMWPTYPASCVRMSTGAGDFAPGSTFQAAEVDDMSAQVWQYTMPNNTGFSSFRFQVNVETGASAGNLTMRFQPTVNWGEVRIGSYVRLREIIAS